MIDNKEDKEMTTSSTVGDEEEPPKLNAKTIEKIVEFRARIYETFGKVSMVLMATPRYRNLPLGDLRHLVLEPLMQDRIAIAQPKSDDGAAAEALAGIAIWASVNEATDARIREQITNKVFPVRLVGDEWANGEIHWLLDVIAPNQRLATAVIANFKQITKGKDLRLHPMIARLVEPEALAKMGAQRLPIDEATPAAKGEDEGTRRRD